MESTYGVLDGGTLILRVVKAFLNWEKEYNQACKIMSEMVKPGGWSCLSSAVMLEQVTVNER